MALSIDGHIDSPAEEAVFSASIHLAGWAFSSDGEPVSVRAHVEGNTVAEIPAGRPRPDVAAAFPCIPGAATSGFDTWLPKRELPDESHFILSVEVSTSQARQTLGTRRLTWIPQTGLRHARGDYRQVWDRVSGSYETARIAVCATADLAEYERSGIDTTTTIAHAAAISPSDTVLEIGCGTGRIGLHMAARCGRWMGADVSRNMLEHARQALSHLPNVSFHSLNGSDLQGFSDDSVDVVYCSGVFMHLDEWDRYRYVSEMFRVLKPGGRAYYDNFNLLSDEGWNFFLEECRCDPTDRPPNISKSSTPQELQQYAVRAGFETITLYTSRQWVSIWGRKPA
jgi:ubiquinone/menaquinone biosynthesis C-methylase UbiE